MNSLTIEDGSITYAKLSDDAKFFTEERVNLIDPNAYTGKKLNVADITALIPLDYNTYYVYDGQLNTTGSWASNVYGANKQKIGQADGNIESVYENGVTKFKVTNENVKYIEIIIYPSSSTKMLVKGETLPDSYISYNDLKISQNNNLVPKLRKILFNNDKIAKDELNDEVLDSLNKLGIENQTFSNNDIVIYDNTSTETDGTNINLKNNAIISPNSVNDKLFFTINISSLNYTLKGSHYLLLTKIYNKTKNIYEGRMLEITSSKIYALRDYDTKGRVGNAIMQDIYTGNVSNICVNKLKSKIEIIINNTNKVYIDYNRLGCTYNDICFGFGRSLGLSSYTLCDDLSYSYRGDLEESINSISSPIANLKWNAIGDSMTEPSDSYHYYISNKYNITVNNYGVSGNTTSDIVNRLSNINTEADIITVFAGTNDFGKNVPIETVKNNVKTIIENLVTNNLGKKIGWILPIQRLDMTSNTLELTLLDYVKAIKEICEQYSIPTLDLYREGGFPVLVPAFANIYINTADKLHPTTAGHIYLSDIIGKWLERL